VQNKRSQYCIAFRAFFTSGAKNLRKFFWQFKPSVLAVLFPNEKVVTGLKPADFPSEHATLPAEIPYMFY